MKTRAANFVLTQLPPQLMDPTQTWMNEGGSPIYPSLACHIQFLAFSTWTQVLSFCGSSSSLDWCLAFVSSKVWQVYNKFEAKHCTYGGPFVGPQNQLVAFIPPSSGPCIRDILHKAHLKDFFTFKLPICGWS